MQMPMPPVWRTTLTMHANGILPSGTAAFTRYDIALNSLAYPFNIGTAYTNLIWASGITAATALPAGTNFPPFYNAYRVLACKIEVTYINELTGDNGELVVVPCSAGSTFNSTFTAGQAPRSKSISNSI